MTTGFQQQHYNFGPILKVAAKPQHLGAKLTPADDREPRATPEKHSFESPRTRR